MSLIKNYCFINLCFGTSAVMTADYAYCSLLPLIMSDIGYTTDQASLTLTINGVAELVSKVLLTIMSMMVNVKSKYLFFAAVIGMGFARTGELVYTEINNQLLYIFILKMTCINAVSCRFFTVSTYDYGCVYYDGDNRCYTIVVTSSTAFSHYRRYQHREICYGFWYLFCYQWNSYYSLRSSRR